MVGGASFHLHFIGYWVIVEAGYTLSVSVISNLQVVCIDDILNKLSAVG